MTARNAERDYSKGIIYKLCCNDVKITDIYVGSTTNFKKRKSCHKYNCANEKGKQYNYKVYRSIRENGGWDNWDMVLVEEYNATTKLGLESRERHWLETLKASLNNNIPTQPKKEYDNKYRVINKETLNKEKKVKYDCECGGKYTYTNRARHFARKKHVAFLENNNVTEEKCAVVVNLTELETL